MEIDEILAALDEMIRKLEALKRETVMIQQEAYDLIALANTWFELHADELPEVEEDG